MCASPFPVALARRRGQQTSRGFRSPAAVCGADLRVHHQTSDFLPLALLSRERFNSSIAACAVVHLRLRSVVRDRCLFIRAFAFVSPRARHSGLGGARRQGRLFSVFWVMVSRAGDWRATWSVRARHPRPRPAAPFPFPPSRAGVLLLPLRSSSSTVTVACHDVRVELHLDLGQLGLRPIPFSIQCRQMMRIAYNFILIIN